MTLIPSAEVEVAVNVARAPVPPLLRVNTVPVEEVAYWIIFKIFEVSVHVPLTDMQLDVSEASVPERVVEAPEAVIKLRPRLRKIPE